MHKRYTPIIRGLVVATMIFSAGALSAASGLHITKQWPVGGAGGWDYLTLNDSGSRLFVSRGTHVDVIDTQTGKIAGSIANTNGVHGITLDEAGNRGYTSNGRADTVTAFDIKTLQTLKEAPVSGHNPDAIVYDPASKHVFTFNGRSKDVSVLDAADLKVIATLAVPDKPEFAVSDGEGQIFVNIESDQGQMVVIDTHKLAVKATWPLPGCASPSGLALDKAHHRLFSVCDGNVMAVTDALSGKQVAKVAIGEGPDAVAYDAKSARVFSSNGEGTLTVVSQESADRYGAPETITTRRGARTMALDSASGQVYLVTSNFGPAPAPTPEQPHPRPVPVADSFTVLVVGLH
jgi:YVTN family beta-propeller protein